MMDSTGSKPQVLVFMGGESGEHDISMQSGAAVVEHLPAAGYQPSPVVISRDGLFGFPSPDDTGRTMHQVGIGEAIYKVLFMDPVCAFIAMHGPYGEDGRIQALCDLMHIPHVGSDVTGSALAMDKWLCKAVYRDAGIPTPDGILLTAHDLVRDRGGSLDRVEGEIGLPCVVKTTRLGSSVGVGIACDRSELDDVADDAVKHGDVLCEAYHPGRELTVPVLEDPETGAPEALPVIEIVPQEDSGFFDYSSKYGIGATQADEICPADIPDDLAAQVSGLAVGAHRVLMLSGFSRTDFMVDDAGVWTLETNTIPGLTNASLFPKAAQVAGLSFSELVGTLVRRALKRSGRA